MIRLILWALAWCLTLGLLKGRIAYRDGLVITLKRAPWWRWLERNDL